MLKRKVYPSWAYSENELEKRDINSSIYSELRNKYKICMRGMHNIDKTMIDNYDIIIGGTPGYAHTLYNIYKNSPNLTVDELALICDSGNLCFGYVLQGNSIKIYED